MKKVIQFHKAFLFTTILSIAVIAFGLVGLGFKGFNLGVDFQSGINQYIQLAYPAATLTYDGTGTCVLSMTETSATLVFSGADVDARTVKYDLLTVGTVNDLAAAMATESVRLVPTDSAGLSAELLIPTYQGNYTLTQAPVLVHRSAKDAAERFGTIEQIRQAAERVGSVSVQNVGGEGSMQYLVRVRDDGSDKEFSRKIPPLVVASLEAALGKDRVVTMKTDYVGAKMSSDFTKGTWVAVALTLAAMLVYVGIRFKIEYAIAVVLAVVHDGLVMVAFIVWSRMEFNATSIAAILTILGYSTNDTIVIFDRIRDELKLNPDTNLVTLLDKAQSEMLGRTFITTFTTMLAVVSLFVFTSGDIKNFALALMVGMVSGVYSTIYIASAFVAFWDKHVNKRRHNRQAAAATPKLAN